MNGMFVSEKKFKVFFFAGILFFNSYFPLQLLAQGPFHLNGINYTSYERVWDNPVFKSNIVIKDIQTINKQGFSIIRLPLAFEELKSTNPKFFQELKKVIRYCSRKNISLVLAYFDHGLSEDNLSFKKQEIITNWNRVLAIIPPPANQIFMEILNEPTVSPESWDFVALDIMLAIREKNTHIPLIVGATNSNSIFELGRMKPFPVEGIIYTFHYYEPFIFTHQGTEWTGNQHATVGVPYPYRADSMPQLSKDAKGTAGEINFRDYDRTGNIVAVEDKISQIAAWAATHDVKLWCTEFGATAIADPESRKNYLQDVSQILRKYQIPSLVWEWEGNFGVKELLYTQK